MAVEFGAVDAGVLAHHLAGDRHRHHAGAAHAGGIHHDRVQTGHGLDAEGFGQVAHRAHHQRRADRHHLGNFAALARHVVDQHGFERRRDKTFDTEAAVVAGVDDVKLIAKFGFQCRHALTVLDPEQQTRIAETRNQRHMVAQLQVRTHDRVDRRQAQTASGKHHRLLAFVAVQGAGQSERPGDAGEGVADVHVVDRNAAAAHGLHHEADRALLCIPIGQRERYQLTFFPGQHAHELAGLRRFGDQWRVHDEFDNAVGQCDFFQNRLRRSTQAGVVLGRFDHGVNLCGREVDVTHNLARRGLTVAGSADRRGAAARSVATRVNAVE